MKWYDDKFSESSSLILPSLYKVSEDVYDEITEISDTEYLYKKKCGIVKNTENPTYENYIVVGDYIIYELPISEQSETVIEKNELASFSDSNTTLLFGNTNMDFDFEIDRRYKEHRKQYQGVGIPISEENINLSNGIKVYEIKATQDNVSALNINETDYQLPITLMTGDRLVWEEVNKSYIYYPADVSQDLQYIPSDCIVVDTLKSSEYETLNSEGKILEITHNEKNGTNEVSFDRINDTPIESFKIQGDLKQVGRLPMGYQELDYISSNINGAIGSPSNTPYIVTDYYPDVKKTNLEVKFKPLNRYPEYGCVYGAYTDFATDCFMFIYSNGETGFRVSGSVENVKTALNLGDIITIKCGDGYLNVIDETNPSKSFSNKIATFDITGRISCPAIIGARRRGSTLENNKSPLMDIYYIRVFEETTLVHEYIPCINPDGIIGVYDAVGKEFLTSSMGKSYNAGQVVSTGGVTGLGGKIGDDSYSFSIEESVNGTPSNIDVSLNTPLFDGENIDLTTGIATRQYKLINSYAGEEVGDTWYSSTGKLETGAIILYKVDEYTETIPIAAKDFSTVLGAYTYKLLNNDYELECPIYLKYDSTDYQDFKYVLDYDVSKSYGISKFVIAGDVDGVGTKVSDENGDYYKLTLECYDVNDKTNKKSYDIKLDDILHEGDTFSLTEDTIKTLDFSSVAEKVQLRFVENTKVYNIKYVSSPNFQTDNEVLISVPYKEIRILEKPVVTSNMGAGVGDGYGLLSWNEVYGATEYQIIIDNEQFAVIDNIADKDITYVFSSEIKGNVYVKSTNDITDASVSETFPILSVPNSTDIENVEITYETNKYKIAFDFDNNSDICKYYKVNYIIDDGDPQYVRVQNTYSKGDTVKYSFTCDNITDNIVLQISPVNDNGVNNYAESQKYITIEDFTAWTYKKDLRKILLCWYDRLENEEGYNIRYRVNRGNWNILVRDGVGGKDNRMVEYIDAEETDILDVCLTAIVGGKPQIYTKPIRMSMNLDTMLVPPIDFSGSRLEYGKLNFSWKDNGYEINHSFELQITDAMTGKAETISIDNNDTGDYSYVYMMDGYGYVTAKVRMVWELGESDYTENVSVYNINVVYDAPPMNRQEHVGDKIKLSWQYYNYVSKYVLYLSINGEEKTVETADFEYLVDIPENVESVHLVAKVKAVFIDGSATNISDSVDFSICNFSNKVYTTISIHSESVYDEYTTILNKGITNLYNLYTFSTVKASWEYNLYEKIIRTYIFIDYPFYENIRQSNIGDSYNLNTIIKCSYEFLYNLDTNVFTSANVIVPMQVTITSPISKDYPIHVSISKVTICCLGDSITAGHPNYWAETGTGNIKSQYEYWLDRRLKGEFNVVNCGYGQEKTDDMLERFDRDVSSLQPRYVIILGGTNDWYQDASTKDLATGYTVMDGAIDNIKEMIKKAWDNNIYPIVCTLTPRNDITEDGKTLWDYFNKWVKEYTTEQSIAGKECAYIDMFNAGKEMTPPMPLEDPNKPYHLNPLCDGDNVFDENGKQLRSGLGVHMNPDGYRVMGYSIPINMFKSGDTGLKLYRDSECRLEEKYNKEEASNPYYEITIPNIRRGTDKEIIKYIKNVGTAPCLYYIYINEIDNMDYYFVNSNGEKTKELFGYITPNMPMMLRFVIQPGFDDYKVDFKLHMMARDLSSTSQ